MKKKRLLCVLLAAFMLIAAAGCGSSAGSVAQPAASAAAASAPVAPAAPSLPEQDPAGPDYNNMSMDELYQLAIKETGTITVYSTTSSAQLAVKKFKAAFPELADRIEYIDSTTKTVANRIQTEGDTGNINADVLQCKDNSGEIFYELVQYDYLDVYAPAAVIAHIDPELLKYGMPIYAGYSPWYYNPEKFPDGCPIESWWDIVQGYDVATSSYIDASGKDNQYWTIYTKDITSASYASLWAQLIVDGDALAAQYEKQYGKPLEYTYMSKLNNTPGIMEFPENNGGVELYWRFTQLMMTELDDGDQVVSAVDASLNGPTLGLCSGGKLKNIENGLQINWVTGLEPYTAFLACDYVYPVRGCDNPAGARLFILFALGGEDGRSGCMESYEEIGRWSVRDDFMFEKTPYTAEEVNLKSPDFEFIYQFYPNVKAYWIYWRNMAPST